MLEHHELKSNDGFFLPKRVKLFDFSNRGHSQLFEDNEFVGIGSKKSIDSFSSLSVNEQRSTVIVFFLLKKFFANILSSLLVGGE